jgi:hypothetical protein
MVLTVLLLGVASVTAQESIPREVVIPIIGDYQISVPETSPFAEWAAIHIGRVGQRCCNFHLAEIEEHLSALTMLQKRDSIAQSQTEVDSVRVMNFLHIRDGERFKLIFNMEGSAVETDVFETHQAARDIPSLIDALSEGRDLLKATLSDD